MEYITTSEEETMKLGRDLAYKIKEGSVFALMGELGSGKTTFVQGFAQGLGIKDKILSPSFVLIRQHKIPNKKSNLFHVDLYRLEDEKDLTSLGLDDLMNGGNIVVIEWAEKAKKLPANTRYIRFEILGESKRKIITW